jgi:hypothetical protein
MTPHPTTQQLPIQTYSWEKIIKGNLKKLRKYEINMGGTIQPRMHKSEVPR